MLNKSEVFTVRTFVKSMAEIMIFTENNRVNRFHDCGTDPFSIKFIINKQPPSIFSKDFSDGNGIRTWKVSVTMTKSHIEKNEKDETNSNALYSFEEYCIITQKK